ncbi:Do family serine endopeptidase [Blattabacterium sp. (Cryptocercus punctulatus) str. Cpu]|uniref:Do family serine endopeptidase n=1 Tax=Blattabacterium sp. (Cryptocercus punctulatus) str. Cpu TaxID=1075399 RepID=UPI0002387129|nr:Do family serine endopeptidase [Blattabacterium sp. (Cryptocercus punctulatus) str. Cpu]AEU09416.1 serine protease [Blattabacterium sp. (Cryptocercus punctulatus) str. Cpu]
MKKIVVYIVISSIMSSVMTIAVYKKYTKEDSQLFPYGSSLERTIPSNSSSLISSAGLPDFTRVVEKTIHAVVNVKNYSKKYSNRLNFDPFDFFFGFPDDFGGRGKIPQRNEIPGLHGSGVIISPDGYIVTNNHVIKDADKIEITLSDQRTYRAKLIGTDTSTDIALLKINEKKLPFIYFSDSNKVQVGEWVLAIGNPFDLNSTVTAGIISAKNRNLGILRGETQTAIESFFQTDAAVNPGNSGGALVNTNGELIGINTAISSNSGNFIGYSFSAPSNLVGKVIQDIKKYGTVQRAYLGVRGMDLSKAEYLKSYNNETHQNIKPQQGFLIGEVFDKSGAYEAGLQKGDIIKNIDGKPIQNVADLSFIVGTKHPGDKVKVNILRNKEKKTFNVTLKDSQGRTKIRKREEITPSELLGATFEILGKDSKKDFGINYGIRITEIRTGRLSSIGLEEGDIILSINGEKIRKPNDVDRILKRYKGDVTIKSIKQNGQVYIVGFEMN